VLFKRFEKYGLRLHSEKTRLVASGSPGFARIWGGSGTPPGTFDFLGFTHHWGKNSMAVVIRRRTARKRFARSLKAIGQWCRRTGTSRYGSKSRRWA